MTHTLIDGVKLTKKTLVCPEDVGLSADDKGDIVVFVNGEWAGRHKGKPRELPGVRVDMRNPSEAWIWSDAGRMYRDHFTPEMIVAHTARQIPFMPHNQTPRVSYYCNMSKQAMVCEPEKKPSKKMSSGSHSQASSQKKNVYHVVVMCLHYQKMRLINF